MLHSTCKIPSGQNGSGVCSDKVQPAGENHCLGLVGAGC